MVGDYHGDQNPHSTLRNPQSNMPGFLLHQGATVLCMHGGQAQPTAPNPRVMVGGQPIVTQAAPYTVAGCPFTTASPMPCVTAQWVTAATRVLAGGQPVVGRRFELSSTWPVHFEVVTDDNGWCVVEPAPFGAFELQAWPQALATPQQRRDYRREHGRDPKPTAVGPIRVPGNQTEVEVRLQLRKPK